MSDRVIEANKLPDSTLSEVTRILVGCTGGSCGGLSLDYIARCTTVKDDLDTIENTGIYKVLEGCENGPFGQLSNGSVLLHAKWDSRAAHQLLLTYSSMKLYYRVKKAAVWNAWREIAFVTS